MILAVAATVSVAAIANPAEPEPQFTNILYPLDGTGTVYLGPPEQVTTDPSHRS